MGQIAIGEQVLDVDLVIFDKDGTLIAFEPVWGWRTMQATERLAGAAPLPAAVVRQALLQNLGYDAAAARTDPNGPLAAAAMSKLYTVATLTLYQLGVMWGSAEQLVATEFEPLMNATPTAEQIVPLGDVAGVFSRLEAAGIPIAVITSDDRQPTEAALRALGVWESVVAIICADDPFPQKPAPDGAWQICQRVGARRAHAMMVGDTMTDMALAENAGLGWRVQVMGLEGESQPLPADFHIDSIEALRAA